MNAAYQSTQSEQQSHWKQYKITRNPLAQSCPFLLGTVSSCSSMILTVVFSSPALPCSSSLLLALYSSADASCGNDFSATPWYSRCTYGQKQHFWPSVCLYTSLGVYVVTFYPCEPLCANPGLVLRRLGSPWGDLLMVPCPKLFWNC